MCGKRSSMIDEPNPYSPLCVTAWVSLESHHPLLKARTSKKTQHSAIQRHILTAKTDSHHWLKIYYKEDPTVTASRLILWRTPQNVTKNFLRWSGRTTALGESKKFEQLKISNKSLTLPPPLPQNKRKVFLPPITFVKAQWHIFN